MNDAGIRPGNRAAWGCAAAALVLTFTTLISSVPENRYTVTSSLRPLDDQQLISLSPRLGKSQVNIAFDRPAQGDVMLITATIAASGLSTGSAEPLARFFLVPRDPTERFDWEASRRITRVYRNMAPTVFTQRIYLEDGFAGVNLVGWSGAQTGAIELRDLRADFLAETPSYRTARLILVSLWIALGLTTLTLLLHAGDRLSYVTAGILAAGLLYGGTLMPKPIVRGGASLLKDGVIAAQSELSSLISSEPAPAQVALPRGPDQRGWLVEPEKLAHLCLCSVFAFCMRRGFGSRHPIPIFFVLLAIVAATEVLQTMTIDRDPSIGDVGIDAMGLLAGLLSAHDFKRGKRPICRYALKS